jgi:DNA-binding transcriptional LysR family regulator
MATNIGDVDFKRLWAFFLVAKLGNLRLAATRLNQTVPAISAKVRLLERDLTVKLFERLPNRLVLTTTGERFFAEVEAIFVRATQAIDTLSLGDEPSGHLSVSMGSDLTWFIAPRIGTFVRKLPRVELSLQIYKAPDALAALTNGDLDVSIGVFQKIPRALERETITQTSLSLLCPNGHALVRRPPPKLEDIARQRLIVLQRHAETRRMIDRTFAKMTIKTGSIIEAANCQTASALVQRGVGVAIVHSLCVANEKAKGVQAIDLSRYFAPVNIAAVYRRGGRSSNLIGTLLDEFIMP